MRSTRGRWEREISGGELFPKLMYVVVKTEFVVPAPRNASKLGGAQTKLTEERADTILGLL